MQASAVASNRYNAPVEVAHAQVANSGYSWFTRDLTERKPQSVQSQKLGSRVKRPDEGLIGGDYAAPLTQHIAVREVYLAVVEDLGRRKRNLATLFLGRLRRAPRRTHRDRSRRHLPASQLGRPAQEDLCSSRLCYQRLKEGPR